MNIDVISTIYTGGEWDADGNVITEPTAEPGFHVNTTELPASLEPYAVAPTTPSRVFAGAQTHFLQFADRAEFEAVMAEWLPVDEQPS